MKRPQLQTEHGKTYPQDKDFRDNSKQNIDLSTQPPLTNTEFTIANQIKHNNAQNDQQSPPQTKEDTHGSTQALISQTISPHLSTLSKSMSLKRMERRIYPIHSTIILKKKRRMLYLPLEFGEITMDGLVDSGAFINAMSWSDYNAIKMNSDSCLIKEYP